VNSRASKLPAQRISGLVNAVLVFLKTKTASFPLAESGGRLPRRVFSVRPTLTEAIEAHAVHPAGLLLFLILRDPLLHALLHARNQVRTCVAGLTHGVDLADIKLASASGHVRPRTEYDVLKGLFCAIDALCADPGIRSADDPAEAPLRIRAGTALGCAT
jgi:hypothetical protein